MANDIRWSKVATTCCVCGIGLVDATSVEFGIGPVCRRKYRYEDALPISPDQANELAVLLAGLKGDDRFPEDVMVAVLDAAFKDDSRRAANVLVYFASVEQGMKAVLVARALRVLGYADLAARIEKRLVGVHLTRKDGKIAVASEFNESFIAEVKRLGGRWSGKPEKVWLLPETPETATGLWDALKRAYPGAVGLGPKGVFKIEG